jgi:hypothetical protein
MLRYSENSQIERSCKVEYLYSNFLAIYLSTNRNSSPHLTPVFKVSS